MEANPLKIQADSGNPYISGLGGWLILVQIGLYFSLIRGVGSIFSLLELFASADWIEMTSRDSGLYHPLWGPIFMTLFVYYVANFIYILFILVHFYGRKRILPTLMIIYHAVNLFIAILMVVLIQMIETIWIVNVLLIPGVLYVLIWILYFRRSVRVKYTFVN